VYNPGAIREQSSVGTYITTLDRSIQQWNHTFLTGSQDRDRRTLHRLEDAIHSRSLKLFDLLVEQLESGPPYNRRVAATALGFTRSDRALSPLLNALSDPDPEVINNALVGLSVLGEPTTPLQGIVHQMRFGSSEQIRGNASLALLECLQVGSPTIPEVVEAARAGLHDDAAYVRTKSAMILAFERDVDSIGALALQLYEDDLDMAAMAASRALALLGKYEIRSQGTCARALTAALGKVNDAVNRAVLRDLQVLSKRNYPTHEEWVQWAHRLP
ncbi:MAG: HEAT repeat domain-containing protein, partial [Planctomycetota bacterium]|nr:HEAT repeat domain-containing protein [Planctomycetota bacterium]